MEKKSKKILWIALAVIVVLVVAVLLYFRFMPAWASLQVLLGFLAGTVIGFMLRWLYGKYVAPSMKGGKDED